MIKQIKRGIKHKIKRIKIKAIMHIKMILCRHAESKDYLRCPNCNSRYFRTCKKFLNRTKWIL